MVMNISRAKGGIEMMVHMMNVITCVCRYIVTVYPCIIKLFTKLIFSDTLTRRRKTNIQRENKFSIHTTRCGCCIVSATPYMQNKFALFYDRNLLPGLTRLTSLALK